MKPHTWTTDCKENLDDVVGKTWKKKDGTPRTNFKGVLYNVVKEFAKETPYIFGLTQRLITNTMVRLL